MNPRHFNLLKLFILFIILGFVVYHQSLFNGFVWDDTDQIFSTHVGNVAGNISNFFFGFHFGRSNLGMPVSAYEAYYKPIFYTSFSVLYSIFGKNALLFHLVQIVLHSINAFLVYIVFSYFFSKNLSFILSLIFLIHPINSEAVLYISALQEPLFFFFGVMAFITLRTKRVGYKRLLIGGSLILLSLLTKETGILFLLVIGVFHLLKKRSSFIKILSIDALVIGIYVLMRFVIANVYFVTLRYVPIMKLSFFQRVYTIPAIFLYYVKSFIFPRDLLISQYWIVSSPHDAQFYTPLFIGALIVSTIVGFGAYLWKSKRDMVLSYVFFSLWFVLGMGLHMQIIPLDMTVADRWFYFPIVGLLGMIGVFLKSINSIKYKKTLIMLSVVLLTLLSLRTVERSFDWKNPFTLYMHDIQGNNSSFDLESNVGAELFRAGRKEEAKKHFERSVALVPDHWVNTANLAGYYYDAKDYTNAEKYYLLSIKNDPYFNSSYENYARMLLFEPNSDVIKAKKFLDNSVKIFPRNGKLWLYLAIADYLQGLPVEALQAAQISVQLTPVNDSIYVYSRLSQNLPLILK
ncbi:tetratricopeptide repeat protein [Candidatus Gottesmanbacteria bacterium]|nr:tetratricopeptide repeat protein [Candidatus Gottesmanbacteria bacterium]